MVLIIRERTCALSLPLFRLCFLCLEESGLSLGSIFDHSTLCHTVSRIVFSPTNIAMGKKPSNTRKFEGDAGPKTTIRSSCGSQWPGRRKGPPPGVP